MSLDSKKLELSQSAAYPTKRLVTEQVSFYRKKNIMEVPKLRGKIITSTKGITFKNSWNIAMVLVCCTFP